MEINTNINQTVNVFKEKLNLDQNFDIVFRTIKIMDKTACIFCVDGFTKSDLLNRIIEYIYRIEDPNILSDAHTFSKSCIPYGEVDLEADVDKLIVSMLSGQTLLLVDGFDKALIINLRSYPQRSTTEPEKDKVLRGSHDGFVESIISNLALIRRRIRTPDFCVQHFSVGSISHTDIAICYMKNDVDQDLLKQVISKLQNAKVDALTMNQESVAEIILKRKWYNPLPKLKFTERPDTTAAQVLEGDIAVVVDNSPSAIILPSSLFHLMEEANDYYFPPIIGGYQRLCRIGIMIAAAFLTPTWILFNAHPDMVPGWLDFILIKDQITVPLVLQLIILELAFDGLQIAAMSTPDTLTLSLSLVAAIILGDYAVDARWFSPQSLLYQAFVTLSIYSMPGFELGYALKFMRIILLLSTWAWGIWGYIAGILFIFIVLVSNKSIAGKCYLYPLIPFDWKVIKHHILRLSLRSTQKEKNNKNS